LVWAKDGDRFVSIGQVLSQDSLKDVSIFNFKNDLSLESITYAKTSEFDGDGWWLSGVEVTQFTDTQVTLETSERMRWNSTLTPDKLGIVAVKPEALSITGLLDYVNYLENNAQDPSRYQLALWRKILQPVSVGVMLLMALSFIFGPLRSVTMGARVIMGVLTGFGFFILNEVFGPVSLVYQLPPFLGALLPSLLFAAIAGLMLRR
jgi:lipopolysaccharide export system permease protein